MWQITRRHSTLLRSLAWHHLNPHVLIVRGQCSDFGKPQRITHSQRYMLISHIIKTTDSQSDLHWWSRNLSKPCHLACNPHQNINVDHVNNLHASMAVPLQCQTPQDTDRGLCIDVSELFLRHNRNLHNIKVLVLMLWLISVKVLGTGLSVRAFWSYFLSKTLLLSFVSAPLRVKNNINNFEYWFQNKQSKAPLFLQLRLSFDQGFLTEKDVMVDDISFEYCEEGEVPAGSEQLSCDFETDTCSWYPDYTASLLWERSDGRYDDGPAGEGEFCLSNYVVASFSEQYHI